jgi:hypothetical protein
VKVSCVPTRVASAAAVLLVASAACGGGGCASTAFRHAEDPGVNGIRYYRPATYVLVKPDYEKQQASVTFWTGPDTSVPYAADPSATWATNTTELKFNRGMLSDVTTETDSTKIATETIAALGEVGKTVLENAAKAASLAAGAAALVSPEKGDEPPPVFLFVAAADGQFRQLYPEPGVAPAAPANPGAAPTRPVTPSRPAGR